MAPEDLPSAGDEARLWELIEAAWAPLGTEASRVRHALTTRPAGRQMDGLAMLTGATEAFIASLTGQCRELTGGELTALDRVTERKLYDIDSAALQAVTDGSQDGFLYSRGFIVAMGRRFYYAVAADVQMAVPCAELEQMCYFFAHLHQQRYGSYPVTSSGISRESCSNPAGWPQ